MDIKMLSNNKNIDFNGKDKFGKNFYVNAWINGNQDVVKLDFLIDNQTLWLWCLRFTFRLTKKSFEISQIHYARS